MTQTDLYAELVALTNDAEFLKNEVSPLEVIQARMLLDGLEQSRRLAAIIQMQAEIISDLESQNSALKNAILDRRLLNAMAANC